MERHRNWNRHLTKRRNLYYPGLCGRLARLVITSENLTPWGIISSSHQVIAAACIRSEAGGVSAPCFHIMSLLPIVYYPDPVLLKVGDPVKPDEFNDDLSATIERMFETMYDARGVGLAAPQVGISRRFFVMDVADPEGKPQPRAFINPEIVTIEGEQVGEEGCLSFPGLYQVVKREMRVIVRAQDVFGEAFELDLQDLAARCVLHETDHCDGIVFLDRMTPLKRELARRNIKRLQQTGEWV